MEYVKSIFVFFGGTMLVLVVLTRFELVTGFGVLVVTGLSFLFCTEVVVRRLHDLGLSGWLWPLFLLPGVNLWFGWALLRMKGDDGPNRFGPPPAES